MKVCPCYLRVNLLLPDIHESEPVQYSTFGHRSIAELHLALAGMTQTLMHQGHQLVPSSCVNGLVEMQIDVKFCTCIWTETQQCE